MSSPAVRPTAAEARDGGGPATGARTGDGKGGTWAVVVAGLCVAATFAACLTFFQGYLDIMRLPGDMPPVNHIPDTPATRAGLLLMRCGFGLFLLVAALGLVGLVAGIRMVRRPDSFRSGVWAIALVACTPILTIMLLSGMGAT